MPVIFLGTPWEFCLQSSDGPFSAHNSNWIPGPIKAVHPLWVGWKTFAFRYRVKRDEMGHILAASAQMYTNREFIELLLHYNCNSWYGKQKVRKQNSPILWHKQGGKREIIFRISVVCLQIVAWEKRVASSQGFGHAAVQTDFFLTKFQRSLWEWDWQWPIELKSSSSFSSSKKGSYRTGLCLTACIHWLKIGYKTTWFILMLVNLFLKSSSYWFYLIKYLRRRRKNSFWTNNILTLLNFYIKIMKVKYPLCFL